MKTFKVLVTRDCTFTQSAIVHVDAEDKEDAQQKAVEQIDQDEVYWEDDDSFHFGEESGVYVADPDTVEEM